MPAKIKTALLIDEKNMMAEGLGKLLEDHPRIALVGAFLASEINISMLRQLNPDVIVYVVFDRDAGVEKARKLRQDSPEVRVLAVSRHSDSNFITELLKAGVQGIFMDDSSFADLVQAILVDRKKWNQIYLDPRVILAWSVRPADRDEPQSASLLSVLTKREKSVLQRLADGRRTKQIAAELGLSPKTVDTHRRRMMQKLSISNMVDLVKLAVREGVTTLEVALPE